MNNNFGSPKSKKEKLKEKKLILPIIVIAAAVIFFCAFSVAYFGVKNADKFQKDNDVPASANASKTENSKNPQTDLQNVSLSNDEMRGVWIATVSNINFPSQKGLSASQLADELDQILETCGQTGFNAIFFQVRPCGDALYNSKIFPWAECLSGTQGKAPDKNFDCLEYLLSKAEAYGIAVHAWINPFRVTNGSAANPLHNVNDLAQSNPARQNPEYVIAYDDGKLYYDPGNPKVRQLVVDGITELCQKYPTLAGVHIDDYFYPYPQSGAQPFDDAESYSKYGNGMTLENWRRNNVNAFVKEAYHAVKAQNKNMKFGVSPFGIWANNTSQTPTVGSSSNGLESYFSLYCDALAWANGGYVDYLVPQIYWSFSTAAAPFDNIARWWNANLDGTGVDYYIGHAAYKVADYGAKEICTQIEFSRSLMCCNGNVFYGYEDIANNTQGIKQELLRTFQNGSHSKEPAEPQTEDVKITYPTGNNVTESATNIHGVSNPNNPVEINGTKISRTKDGYFTYFANLSDGENVFNIKSGNTNYEYKLNKTKTLASAESSEIPQLENFEITQVTPNKPMWIIPGDTVVITCCAPSGSKVTAKIGNRQITLTPTYYNANTQKNYKETYKGSIKFQEDLVGENSELNLGNIEIYAEKNGKTAQYQGVLIKQLGKSFKMSAQVTSDYSYLKTTTVSSFYTDPLPASVGMKDYITAYVNGYYKLRCGYYISEENVKISSQEITEINQITQVTVAPNIKDKSNNKQNSTDIVFTVFENVPIDVSVNDAENKFTVKFFNTDNAQIPTVEVSPNPIIKSGFGYADSNNLFYEFQLKDSENYYGFNIVNFQGSITVKLNNPQTLADGKQPLAGKTVAVDAGHGGEDMGAQGLGFADSNLNEADLNLAIALNLEQELKNLGATVIMIRNDDTTYNLLERAEYLTEIFPDMLISIHHNSVNDNVNAAKARGYLGLYGNSAGVMLANSVADTVCGELSRYKRATSYQALAIARNHRFPSTLCEMSFISCPEEFQWTISPGNYQRSAKALENGIIEFYKNQEKYLEY